MSIIDSTRAYKIKRIRQLIAKMDKKPDFVISEERYW